MRQSRFHALRLAPCRALPRRLGPRRACWLAVAGLVLLAPVARAQTTEPDTGTIYFGQQKREEAPSVWFSPVHGLLELRYTQSDSDTSTAGGTDSHTRDALFEETLTLNTQGYVVHPNLVEFHLSVTGGLQQDHFSDQDTSGSSNGTVYGWDTSVTFLRNQPAPFTIYTRRNESFYDVPFGPTERTTTTQSGAILDYRTSESYMQFEAYHEEDEQSGLGDSGTDFSQTHDVFRGIGQSQLSSNQTLNWNFTLEDASYDSSGESTQQQSVSGSVSHVVSFGDGNRSSLSSGLSGSQTTGDFPTDTLRWTEHLHLWHTPQLETNYDYVYEKFTFEGASSDRQAAYADVRHRLYKSLVSTGRIRWEDLSSEGSSTTTYGADLFLNYRKTVPNGELLIDTQASHEQQDISGSGVAVVANQPFSFVGLDAVQVTQPNAIPSSILVRDAVSGRVYTEGVDYTVTSTPLGPQIDRIIGGNIVSGQPLLLSYDFEPLSASQIDTNSYGIGARYAIGKGPLAGLMPYVRFYGQDQTISGGTAQPNSVRDYAAGSYYTVGPLTLRAEREWYDSTLYPYDAWRYEARLTYVVSPDTSVASSLMYTDTQYHDPEDQTRSWSFNTTLSHRFSTKLSGSVYAAYVNVDSDTGGQTEGLEEGLQANYNLLETRLYLRLRNSTLNSDSTDQQFQFLQIGLTRAF